jgi:hypothetical protein
MRATGITVTTTIPAIRPRESPACCAVLGVIDPGVLVDVVMGNEPETLGWLDGVTLESHQLSYRISVWHLRHTLVKADTSWMNRCCCHCAVGYQ